MFGFFEDLFTVERLLAMLYSLPGLLIALSFHEFAHAYSAYLLGDYTARNAGRMTVSPLAHLDPIGFVFLLVARFGWAKPVPVSTYRLRYGRWGQAIVSLSGVTMNLILAFIFAIIFEVVRKLGVTNEIVLNILEPIVVYNIALFLFNLIPVHPLDGYQLIRGLVVGPWGGNKFFQFMDRYGMYILLALVLTGVTDWIMSFVTNIFWLLIRLADMITLFIG